MTSRQSAGEADQLIRRYLTQLDEALQGVGASRREEILANVREHIDEGRAGLDPDDAATVRTLLNRVGDLAAIAAEAGAPSPDSRRWDAWAGCTTSKITLPLGVAVLLAAAGLATHLLPPIHLMRTRRRQRFTIA
jgi:hypothetical protein